MVELLFALKHMTMYFVCQFVFLDHVKNEKKFLKTTAESFLIAVACTWVTYCLKKVIPVAFIGVSVMILAGIYHHLRNRRKMISAIFLNVDLYVLSLFSNIMLGAAAYTIAYLFHVSENKITVALLNQSLYVMEMILLCWYFEKRKKKKIHPYWFNAFSILCCVVMLCSFVIIMPHSFTRIHAEITFILVAMVSCVGLAVWFWERLKENEEKQKLLAEIKQLRSQVHHYKEFIPAMKRKFDASLEELKRKTTDIKIMEKFKPLVEEIDRLYEEQMEESRKEFLQAGFLAKTGVVFVDALLETYCERAHEEGVSFDVRVFDSPLQLLRMHLIPQMKLEELLGDLLANALHAIERKPIRFDEAIEVDMGVTDDGFYEIDIYDTGEPFPLFILEDFGKRGLTTGGTGEGLANMLEILHSHGIALKISEYTREPGEFSKCLTLRFAGDYTVTLNTERAVCFHLASPDHSMPAGL